jgi:hypothetical protein
MRFSVRPTDLAGWAVFSIALVVYGATMAPTASFWDCGEFIACANELEVTHPPGAPLFLLLGRLMAMLGGSPSAAAGMINMLSVLSGSFTALFTCWITAGIAARALAKTDRDSRFQELAAAAAGVLAGLACTFADTLWFNAVEAEVYAMSSCFTALVVWLMLKWEARAGEPGQQRWLVLIAYVMGLSTGVHLLNLLTIPALGLIYYFRMHRFSLGGLLLALGISLLLLLAIQYGVLQSLFRLAWQFEQVFTGTVARGGSQASGWGLAKGSGSLALLLLLGGLLLACIAYSQAKKKAVLNLLSLSTLALLLGFSSYALIFVRSQANPPIDMNNPENILTFLSYMQREQYGERPLLRGPLYNALPAQDAEGRFLTESKGKKYILLEGQARYVEDVERQQYVYAPEDQRWLPRMYSPERYAMQPFGYREFVADQGQDPQSPFDDRPTAGEDWRFLLEYQLGHMYLRYFMWNFAGRSSDWQDAGWEDGLIRRSHAYEGNKARNHYYLLPLLLGLLGAFWLLGRSPRFALITALLFIMTGLAIIIYLNQYPGQPRERDYAYAGSFQAFAVWIGLGLLSLAEAWGRVWAQRRPIRALLAAGLTALPVPGLMLARNWDDHTRRGRWVDVEFAKNLLESCDPEAILLTGGDNDTFPLWYAQEVEGYRSDVRVVNLELLISDWYINQMRMPQNASPALPIRLPAESYAGESGIFIETEEKVRMVVLPSFADRLAASGVLTPEQAAWASDSMRWSFRARGSDARPYLLRSDSILLHLVRNIAAEGWQRPLYFANTLSPDRFLGLQPFLRLEGMAYRLLPLAAPDSAPRDLYQGWIDRERMEERLLRRFRYQGLDDPQVNLDEHIRDVIVGNYRNSFFRLANSYTEEIKRLREGGSLLTDAQQARLAFCQSRIRQIYAASDSLMPDSVIPPSLNFLTMELEQLDEAGMQEELLEQAAHLGDFAIRKLRSISQDNVPLSLQTPEMRVCLGVISLFHEYGEPGRAADLAAALQAQAGSALGRQLQQQLQSAEALEP